MSRYLYDDFRLTFARHGDSEYLVRAERGGRKWNGTFRLPLPSNELDDAVLSLAGSRRSGRTAGVTREVGSAAPRDLDAAQLGSKLADALFAGEIGDAYQSALQAVDRREGRGLRLTLSLKDTPELLSIPWEFLYRRPTFLAVQPHLPLVRHLAAGPIVEPPVIDGAVRILGVVASPVDLAPLDVAGERRRVEDAVRSMRALGRVELDWLEPATPRRLRQALRDHRYHAIHYVGHGDFATAGDGSGEGLLFLEDPDDASAAPLDSTTLANLLGDQTQLQLVVLNSCEGARTTATDPFAGVATTLIQAGVPAVVAMQFEISDEAAIVFAEELYTNLVGRQDPIDASVAEARKAIFVEVDETEWATPVLFLRDPEIRLFCFAVPALHAPALTAPVLDVLASVTRCPWPPPQPVGATLVTADSAA